MRDDTTRFLCGAAHRDEEFADSAIREYLVESTRSIPRSPGVNVGAVLREAVAGRTRRKVRDGLLLVLSVVVLFAATGAVLVAWLLIAAVVSAATGSRLASLRQRQASTAVRGPAVLGLTASVIALFFALFRFMEELDDTSNYCRRRLEECGPVNSDAEFALVIIGIALVFAVLLADRVIVWLLVTKSFRRNGFRTGKGERELWRNEWTIRRLGHANYAEALALYPTDEDGGPDDPDVAQVIVYHGYRPFTGPVICSNTATAGKARAGNTTKGRS
ncbi:hypothetical protein V1227_34010 [Lentzea sp. DG1S-22]|uniref:hypothetical protein n=1 Tax=Lentzea sp. DG1S-22 TaxID=3108822 RepID=UPI002E767680|nr:hypothetical protein [Lentzea sp. DG1S-22]WVH79986.1 hypothetical protein V1227_34010 [Lentzea sp. DG1S-22]